jgi:hypothetical protein
VRGRAPAALVGHPTLEHERRLPALRALHRVDERPAALEPLQVQPDHRGARVVEEVLVHLDRVDVGAVADRQHPGEPPPHEPAQLDDVAGRHAALRQHADRARLARGAVDHRQAAGRRVGAHAVRAHQADATGAGRAHHRALQGLAVAADLAEAAADDLGDAHPAGGLGEEARHVAAGDRDVGVVDRLGDLGQAPDAGDLLDGRCLGVQHVRPPRVAELPLAAQEDVAQRHP